MTTAQKEVFIPEIVIPQETKNPHIRRVEELDGVRGGWWMNQLEFMGLVMEGGNEDICEVEVVRKSPVDGEVFREIIPVAAKYIEIAHIDSSKPKIGITALVPVKDISIESYNVRIARIDASQAAINRKLFVIG